MMDTKEDPWWLVAVGLLIGLLILAALIPVYLIKPMVATVQRLAESPLEAELSPARKSPTVVLPVLAIGAGVFLSALSVWKIYDERQTNSRWTWMLVAAGMTLLWAILMLQLILRIGGRLAAPG